MGSSRTYRKPPGWEKRNTPGAEPKVSRGSVMNAQGTHMSGYDKHGQKASPSARNKSTGGMMSAKNPGPHGYS